MPDPIFSDPRLAPLYDAFDDERDDLAAYVGIVEELGAHEVLDVGCGTGSLAVLLASAGCSVTGMDPAEASLDVARAKPGAEAVRWFHGDASSLPLLRADLAVMTGNVAQVFLTDADWSRTLQGIRGVLREDGHLVFETRRPADRAWERWAADTESLTRVVPGVGEVVRRGKVTEIAPPYVSFEYTFGFPDGSVVSSASTLRFRGRAEVEDSLAAAGFRSLEVRQAPDRPGREYVFVAQRVA